MSSLLLAFAGVCVTVLKELNGIVNEPYMDEPFHVPQAQAYCRGDFETWDPKITTPPGLYLLSFLLKKLFLFKCTLPMLRLTPMLCLLALPIALTRLLCFHKRQHPPTSILTPVPEAVVLSCFPIAWFFGFLYYTETPSLLFVVWTVIAASQGNHWLAALLGLISCTFRQTNIIWVLYAYGASQLTWLRFRRAPNGTALVKLHDPPALAANLGDVIKAVLSIHKVLWDILPAFVPYAGVLAAFAAFVIWNGGIVLGDKSNHIPSLHMPQLYYFIAAATFFGWPVLLAGKSGPLALVRSVQNRMLGTKIRCLITVAACIVIDVTVKHFTIHHPFLLSDNRHYTFYVWRRIYLAHPLVPYALAPVYLACAWAWYVRVGDDQSLLQSLLLPVLIGPTLLPTPLLEPRYFLIPYVLLRAQIKETRMWGVWLECAWYMMINFVTMGVFLYFERKGVGRFMW